MLTGNVIVRLCAIYSIFVQSVTCFRSSIGSAWWKGVEHFTSCGGLRFYYKNELNNLTSIIFNSSVLFGFGLFREIGNIFNAAGGGCCWRH